MQGNEIMPSKKDPKKMSDLVKSRSKLGRKPTRRESIEGVRYRALVEQVPAIIYIDSAENMYHTLYINPQLKMITGYDPEEWMADDNLWNKIIFPDDRERIMKEWSRTDDDNEPSIPEYRIITRDGRVIWVRDESRLICDRKGKPLFWQGVMIDITARKEAEEEIRRAQQRMEMLVTSSTVMLYACNAFSDFDATFVSDNIYAITGYTKEEFLSKGFWTNHIHPEDSPKVLENLAILFKQNYLKHEYRFMFKDGTYHWMYDELKLLRDSSGNPLEILGTWSDITERKQAEEELRHSQEETAHTYHLLLALNQVAHAVQRARTTEDVYSAIQSQITQLGYFTTGFELTEDGHSLYIAHVSNRADLIRKAEKATGLSLHDFHFRPKAGSIYQRVLVDGETVFVPDSAQAVAETLPEKLRSLGQLIAELVKLNQTIFAPLMVGAEPIGVLSVSGPDLTEADNPSITAFANQAAIAIQNTRMYELAQHEFTECKRVEEALRETEGKYRALFEGSSQGILATDIETNRFIDANPSICRILGYSMEELLRLGTMEIHPQEAQDEIKSGMERQIQKGRSLSPEVPCLRKDGTIFYADISSATIIIHGRRCAVDFFADVTERKQAEDALRQSNKQLRALTSYWQSAIEAERTRIAREIHDEFGQSLTAIKMDLNWLANRLPEGNESIERIHGMDALVDNSFALIRRIATDLRPNLLDDLGLNAALDWQARDFSRRSGVPCKLNLTTDDLTLDPVLNTTLFRIFQETLTNVSRHAQATYVNASLQKKGKTLILTIHDNGVGFQESELNNSRSLGLLSLRERALQWGGETTIRSTVGKGTTVTTRIPLPASPVNGGSQ